MSSRNIPKNSTSENNNHTLSKKLFPFITWLAEYRLSFLRPDILAGLTVAVILIPQSMAYAMLAGLPPVYGLYAATIAPVIAALWGSLRQLSTGPIAITSLLVLTTLTPLAEPETSTYISLSFVLAFMVGGFYLLLGVTRLGIMMSFISHSSVKGFTAAAALIIISTQLPHFFGINVEHHEYVLPMVYNIVREIPSMNPHTLGMGILAFLIIFILKRIDRRLPASLIALVIVTFLLRIFRLDQMGVAIIGTIPRGLPDFSVPPVTFQLLSQLTGPAIVIALVSFAETYSVSKAISAGTKQKINVDQELVGQGLANVFGSFLQCYPVSGSFSRSAISYATGARTGIFNIISSALVILSLLFLTPLFHYIPKAALAAVVINAVLLLFHPGQVISLLKKNRQDGIVALIVFSMGLLIKPDYALLLGVMISLFIYLWKTMHPRIVRITRDPDFKIFLNGDTHRKPSCPQILHLRTDSEIYFGNAQFFLEHVLERLDEQNTPVKFLLLDFHAVACIDITGIDELRILLDEAKQRGVRVAFLNVHLPVHKVFMSSGFIKDIDNGLIFEGKGTATETLFSQVDHGYCREVCTLSLFRECATVK